jgi:hypothetical protein
LLPFSAQPFRIYKTIILPVVLYGCGTWNIESRGLGRIFGPRADEVISGSTKLHNEELHNVYSSESTIRMVKSMRMRWAGNVA